MLSNISLKDIATWTGAKVASNFPGHLKISDISTDSRTIQPGCVFAAIRGEKFDGRTYVAEVAKKGAIAAIVESGNSLAAYPTGFPIIEVTNTIPALAAIARELRLRFKGPVFALTGSAGKSSTKNMLGSLLGTHTLASPKSFNNLQGVSQTLFLLQDDTRKVVLEMGMNAQGEIAEICKYFEPEFALITNIGTAHIGRLGGQEPLYRAKKELFDAIAANPSTQKGIAINLDDPLIVRAVKETFPADIQQISYSSTGKNADVRILKKSLHPETGALQVEMEFGSPNEKKPGPPKHSGRYEVPVFGLHQAENLAAAVAAALLLGETPQAIESRLPLVRSGEHRGEMFLSPRGVSVLDESYNSNPSALILSMQSAFEMGGAKRRVLVLGEMKELENFSEELHIKAAKALVEVYRSKKTPFILIGVGKHFAPFAHYVHQELPEIPTHLVADAGAAIKALEPLLKPQDLVLVKGSRGVELDRVVKWLQNPIA